MKFLNFLFIFVGHFRPSGLGSGSETLEYSKLKFKIQACLINFASIRIWNVSMKKPGRQNRKRYFLGFEELDVLSMEDKRLHSLISLVAFFVYKYFEFFPLQIFLNIRLSKNLNLDACFLMNSYCHLGSTAATMKGVVGGGGHDQGKAWRG
jgi:hypothetical protein